MSALALVVALATSPAQVEAAARDAEDAAPTAGQTVGLSVAYYGEIFTHPGLVLGAVFMPVHDRRSRHALLVSPNLGWYLHPNNHHGLFVDAQLGYRFRADRRAPGFVFQLQAGVGYLHTFVTGLVYERDDDGALVSHRDRGRPSVRPSGAFGFGYDLSARGSIPLEPFVRVELHGRYPFNDYTLFGFAAQLGVIYRFALARPSGAQS